MTKTVISNLFDFETINIKFARIHYSILFYTDKSILSLSPKLTSHPNTTRSSTHTPKIWKKWSTQGDYNLTRKLDASSVKMVQEKFAAHLNSSWLFLSSRSTLHHILQCASLWWSQSHGLLSSCTSWPRHHRWFRNEWWHHTTWWWTSETQKHWLTWNIFTCVSLTHTHMANPPLTHPEQMFSQVAVKMGKI